MKKSPKVRRKRQLQSRSPSKPRLLSKSLLRLLLQRETLILAVMKRMKLLNRRRQRQLRTRN
jgi:hypothetical protein